MRGGERNRWGRRHSPLVPLAILTFVPECTAQQMPHRSEGLISEPTLGLSPPDAFKWTLKSQHRQADWAGLRLENVPVTAVSHVEFHNRASVGPPTAGIRCSPFGLFARIPLDDADS